MVQTIHYHGGGKNINEHFRVKGEECLASPPALPPRCSDRLASGDVFNCDRKGSFTHQGSCRPVGSCPDRLKGKMIQKKKRSLDEER